MDFQSGSIQLGAKDTKIIEDARLGPFTLELTELLKSLHEVRYPDEQKVLLVKGAVYRIH